MAVSVFIACCQPLPLDGTLLSVSQDSGVDGAPRRENSFERCCGIPPQEGRSVLSVRVVEGVPLVNTGFANSDGLGEPLQHSFPFLSASSFLSRKKCQGGQWFAAITQIYNVTTITKYTMLLLLFKYTMSLSYNSFIEATINNIAGFVFIY